jgi:phosphotransferase system HPr-like phosphotransfer protein
LGAEKGDQLLIKVMGEDEKEAYQSLISLINNKFNEE